MSEPTGCLPAPSAVMWRAERCTDEYMENCACIVVQTGPGRAYVADAATPELAAQIVAEHNRLLGLNEAGVAA
ncbi:MAG TPA: hypothetical protein VIP77_11680 [Jiangellaceae bacterium]